MAKKKVVEAPDRAQLEALAKEMNEVMGLDPVIKFNRKTTDEDLINLIKENAVDPDTNEPCIYNTDFEEDPEDDEKVIFSEDAEKTLELLEIEIAEEEAEEPEEETEPAKPAKGKKAAKEEKEEPAAPAKGKGKKAAKEEVEEESEEEPEEEAKPAKGKGKKEEAPAKPAKGKAAPAKAEKPAKKKEDAEPRYKRYQSIGDVLLKNKGKMMSMDDLAEQANNLFIKKGGNGAVPQSLRIADQALQLLETLELIEFKGDKFKYLG